jgi:uncharacterized membrane protein YdcZ (DUF606 family)
MNHQPDTISKRAVSFGLSLSICSFLNAVLVIIKEKSPAVQAAMQKLTGHHWITHSAIVLAAFFILGFVCSRANISINRLIQTIVASVIISSLVIVGFYLVGD